MVCFHYRITVAILIEITYAYYSYTTAQFDVFTFAEFTSKAIRTFLDNVNTVGLILALLDCYQVFATCFC